MPGPLTDRQRQMLNFIRDHLRLHGTSSRWFVNFRLWLCYFLKVVGMHKPDCQKCARFEECWGDEIRKRLEELRQQETAQTDSGKPEDNGQAVA